MNSISMLNKPKVLIICHLINDLESLQISVKSSFHETEVFLAKSGMDGLEIARKHLPDIVLLDENIGDPDVFQTARWMKKESELQYTPIIVLTTDSFSKQSRITALECGCESFLTKPVDQEELKALFNVLLKYKNQMDVINLEKATLIHLVHNQTIAFDQEQSVRKMVEKVSIPEINIINPPGLSYDELTIHDLFEIKELQEIQDSFSKATQVASIITTPEGLPITKPSNFCRLCRDVIRKTDRGLQNCMKSDAVIGSQNPDKPTIMNCLSGGLWDAGASIMVGDRHIANWLIGQVKNEQQDEAKILQYANEIGADPDEFLNALREVPEMTLERFTQISEMLFLISKQLSWKAFQNIQQTRIINRLQETEASLTESQALYQSYLNSVGDQMFIKDSELKYLVVNQVALDCYRLTKDQIIGKKDHEVFPDDFAARCAIVDQIVKNERREVTVEDKVGELVFEIKKFPIILPDGRIYVGGIVRDITKRYLNEEAIRQSRQSYYDIFNSVSEAIYIQNPENGVFIDVNKGAEIIYGVSREKILGQTPYTISAPGLNNMDEIWQMSKKAFESGISARFDFWAVRNNGEVFPKEVIVNRGKYFGKDVMIATARDISLQKKAEEELKSILHRNKALLDANPDMMFLFDHKGVIVDFHSNDRELLIAEPAAFIGRHVSEVLPNDLVVLTHQKIAEVLNSNELIVGYYQLKLKHRTRNFESRYVACGDNYVLSIVRDITDLKRAESLRDIQYQLSKAVTEFSDLDSIFRLVHALLANIIDVSNFFIALYNPVSDKLKAPYQYDKGGRIEEWSAAKSCTGLVIKNNKTIFLSRSDGERLLKEGIIENVGEVAESWLGVPLRNGGLVVGAMVVQDYENADAFDEKDIAAFEAVGSYVSTALRKHEDEQRILLLNKSVEQSPVSIIITDKDGNINYVNPKFCEISGFSFQEAVGQNPRLLKSGEQLSDVYQNLWDTISRGNSWTGELQNKRKNGELFWESVNISPIYNNQNQITNFIAVKEDITNKKQLFDDLRIATEHALESDRLKTAFLNNISHEIRTPFNAILGFLALLNDEDISKEDRGYYTTLINQGSERLMNTLNDIVEVSKIQTSQTEITPQEERINLFLKIIENENLPLASNKNLTFIINNGIEASDLTFDLDYIKLKTILNHLIENAIKFTSSGTVSVDVSFENNNLVFAISDTGIGIPKEKQDSIFEPFIQGDTSNSRNYEGTGLGLTIVKGYINLLQGSIDLKSTPGQGTRFLIRIPANVCNTELAAESLPDNELVFGFDKKHIVVAEDDDANYFYIQMVLVKAGYTVSRALNGVELLALINQFRNISAVILDIKMPEMDGYTAVKQLRTINSTLPVVALTAYSFPSDRIRALESGCTEYLSKPVGRSLLLETLSKVIWNQVCNSN